MPDLIGPKVSFYEYNVSLNASTNSQRIFPETNVNINERSTYTVLLNISGLTQNTLITVADNNGRRLYNKRWSNTNSESDFDPDAGYVQIRLEPCGQRFVINFQSVTAEAATRTIGVCVKQETP